MNIDGWTAKQLVLHKKYKNCVYTLIPTNFYINTYMLLLIMYTFLIKILKILNIKIINILSHNVYKNKMYV